jgi:potassium/hydrogen antiporter
MSTAIIITICSLLLLAYIFDISSTLTRIPSVILLLLLGWMVRQATNLFHIHVPDLNPLLPILGTIGLILIVLEGALELEMNKSKVRIIRQSFLAALLPMVALALLLALAFRYTGHVSFKTALVNAIPFCTISSAIAIPTARNYSSSVKEFVIYESSLSDIMGVLFFNFIALNEYITAWSFGSFAIQIIIITIVSFISVLGLSFLLSRIKHHITFSPIILLLILIYSVAKVYELPGLIFVLIFGLFLGNLDEMKRFRWIKVFRPVKLDKEVAKFKEITVEATFLIRALFFLLFGYLMEAKEILDTGTIPWAVTIVAGIMLIRWITLKISGLPGSPLLFLAPRGLITVLLFLTILPGQSIPFVNKSLIIQSVILTVLAMMFGLMSARKNITSDREDKVNELQ